MDLTNNITTIDINPEFLTTLEDNEPIIKLISSIELNGIDFCLAKKITVL